MFLKFAGITTDQHQVFRAAVGKSYYAFELYYCPLFRSWFLDILDADGKTPICRGRRVTTNYMFENILLPFSGKIYAKTIVTGNPPIGQFCWGKTHLLGLDTEE